MDKSKMPRFMAHTVVISDKGHHSTINNLQDLNKVRTNVFMMHQAQTQNRHSSKCRSQIILIIVVIIIVKSNN